MKTRFFCVLIVGCAAPLLGQQPLPAPSMAPLPPGPLLKRAPDFSTWTINCTGTPTAHGAPAASGTAGGGQGREKGGAVTQLTVVKTGSTTLEYYVDSGGQRHEVWHVGGLRIILQLVGGAKPLVCPDYGGGDIYSINFAASDFAGLDWISADTYSGMVKYQGRDCIVFNSNVSPLEGLQQRLEAAGIEQARALHHHVAGAVKIPATACIDLDTRLPLFVQFGGEKCIYQYGPAPRALLQLPAQLAGPAEAYEHKIEVLSAPASRPF